MGKFIVDQYIERIYKAGERCKMGKKSSRQYTEEERIAIDTCIHSAMSEEFSLIRLEEGFLKLPSYSKAAIEKIIHLDGLNEYRKLRVKMIFVRALLLLLLLIPIVVIYIGTR